MRTGRPKKDYSKYDGMRYGRITIEGLSHKNQYGIYFADTVCDCGTQKKIRYADLDSGRTKSCGCLHHEGNRRTHGKKGHPLYGVWCGIKARCYNPNNQDYAIYGGKGVELCSDWHDFQAFYDWSVSSGYKSSLSIDRINSDGNYCPENCRWADSGVQARNTNRNVYIEIDGITKTVSEWARDKGVPPKRIYDRINKLGWSPDQAVLGRVNDRKKHEIESTR